MGCKTLSGGGIAGNTARSHRVLYRLTQAALSVCVFLCLWTGAAHATGGEEPVTWTYIIGGSYPINRVINGNDTPPSSPCASSGESPAGTNRCCEGLQKCSDGVCRSNCCAHIVPTRGCAEVENADGCVTQTKLNCGTGQICTGNACQSCPENYVPNANKTACVCGITSCPAGQKKDGCTCVSCGTLPDGHEWTTGCTSKCVRTAADCDANQEFDATTCQCKAKTCVDTSENYTCPVENGTDVNGCPAYREKTVDDCVVGQYLNGCDCTACPDTETYCDEAAFQTANEAVPDGCAKNVYQACVSGQCGTDHVTCECSGECTADGTTGHWESGDDGVCTCITEICETPQKTDCSSDDDCCAGESCEYPVYGDKRICCPTGIQACTEVCCPNNKPYCVGDLKTYSGVCCPYDSGAVDGQCCGEGEEAVADYVYNETYLCCPKGAGAIEGKCCGSGEQATYDDATTSWMCCPFGSGAVKGKCCQSGEESTYDMSEGGYMCCPKGVGAVNGKCCDLGEHTVFDTKKGIYMCCPSDSHGAINGQCCGSGEYALYDENNTPVCCPEGSKVENGICCPAYLMNVTTTYCDKTRADELNADIPTTCSIRYQYQACADGLKCDTDQTTCICEKDGEPCTTSDGVAGVWKLGKENTCECVSSTQAGGGDCAQVGCCYVMPNGTCHCGCSNGQVCTNGHCCRPSDKACQCEARGGYYRENRVLKSYDNNGCVEKTLSGTGEYSCYMSKPWFETCDSSYNFPVLPGGSCCGYLYEGDPNSWSCDYSFDRFIPYSNGCGEVSCVPNWHC